MAGKDETLEARLLDLLEDIVDMVGQRDPGVQLGLACAEAFHLDPQDLVPSGLEVRGGPFVELDSAPGAMDQYVVCHRSLPCPLGRNENGP